jgi:D-glycero-alpha-D-manno-heptose 1-phosphate guanylyltransferase
MVQNVFREARGMDLEAIILAGGAGTRLRSVVPDLPKPMADVAGRPFLAYQFDYLSAVGVSRVILSVGYLRERIMDWFGVEYNGIAISYAVEEEPLGTGGAIREALRLVTGDRVLVLNGDTWFPVDLRAMQTAHDTTCCHMTMALKQVNDISRYGAVTIEGGRVSGFAEKGRRSSGYINGGVYLINRAIEEFFPRQQRFSFESDLLEAQIERIVVCPFVSDAYFIDIGIPEDYYTAQTILPGQTGAIG